ncbi:unnamed protein product [Moneuplotes crassus]|uniref:Macro domain-containing protein n=1 Tax=Euplotes crassus TaxID=5936 RepID=A0AAD1U080_EUPCR|nr:unnamed protein product [Moneuplotes crassus]
MKMAKIETLSVQEIHKMLQEIIDKKGIEPSALFNEVNSSQIPKSLARHVAWEKEIKNRGVKLGQLKKLYLDFAKDINMEQKQKQIDELQAKISKLEKEKQELWKEYAKEYPSPESLTIQIDEETEVKSFEEFCNLLSNKHGELLEKILNTFKEQNKTLKEESQNIDRLAEEYSAARDELDKESLSRMEALLQSLDQVLKVKVEEETKYDQRKACREHLISEGFIREPQEEAKEEDVVGSKSQEGSENKWHKEVEQLAEMMLQKFDASQEYNEYIEHLEELSTKAKVTLKDLKQVLCDKCKSACKNLSIISGEYISLAQEVIGFIIGKQKNTFDQEVNIIYQSLLELCRLEQYKPLYKDFIEDMEVKLGIKEKDEGEYQDKEKNKNKKNKDKKKEKTKKKKNHKENIENSNHVKARTPRKPVKSSRQQEMRETDYFEKLKDRIIEAFENINQTLCHKEDRKAVKEEFRDIVELSENSTLFDEHHQAVVDECDNRGKLIQESAKVVEETSQVDKKIYQVEDEKNNTQEYIDKIEEYNQNADKFTAQKESLSKFIKEESKPCKKEKARLAEAADRLTFIYHDTRITVRKNNLIEEAVDAIINPANENLRHEGGAARAIADNAGDEFHQDCDEYLQDNDFLKPGDAMYTRAGGSLKCDYVIHTVGPRLEKNRKAHKAELEQLKSCFKNILRIMKDKNLYDISIPAISTGIFNFPLNKCVQICGQTIKNAISNDPEAFKDKEIIICNFDESTTRAFEEGLQGCIYETPYGDSDEESKTITDFETTQHDLENSEDDSEHREPKKPRGVNSKKDNDENDSQMLTSRFNDEKSETSDY